MKSILLHCENKKIESCLRRLNLHNNIHPAGRYDHEIVMMCKRDGHNNHFIRLNAKENRSKAQDKNRMNRLLELNGLKTGGDRSYDKEYESQRFMLPIFQLETLAVFQRQIGLNSTFREMKHFQEVTSWTHL